MELHPSGLFVMADESDDVVIVGANKRFANLLTVTLNGQAVKHFALSAVTHIVVDAGGGNDKIWVDSALDPMGYTTAISGAAGDDMITCGAGNDLIDAGDGNDKIYANGGNDTINGEAGRDSIWAGAGNDVSTTSVGNDRVYAEAGDDNITSGKGHNIINAGDGNDTLFDAGGVNWIDFGGGNDSGPKIVGGGTIYGGAGNDTIVAVGGAILYGEDGNDHLQAWWIDGGKGNDTLHGLDGNDEIHGGEDDDLIRGHGGRDVLLGNDGNDALFGGGDTDTLFGGAGSDNLYGTDGHADTRKHLAGNDDGFGERGSDWFETDYRWRRADRNADDQPVAVQVTLAQDPSAGQYIGGTFMSGGASGVGNISVSSGTLRVINVGSSTFTGVTKVGGAVNIVDGTFAVTPQIQTTSLGPAGWLSSGAYDTAAEAFVPPPMVHTERIKAQRVLLQIPDGWNLGGISVARDDIVWYQVWRDGATPPLPNGSIPISLQSGSLVVSSAAMLREGQILIVGDSADGSVTVEGTLVSLGAGTYVWDGDSFVAGTTLGDEARYGVPTVDGGSIDVVQSTPHLYDGVENGAYRYLGVKRGTIVVSTAAVTEPQWTPLDAPLLAVPPNAALRIAGGERVFRTSVSYDALPTGGPRLRGIGVDGGGIWLPTDGSAPYFSSGRG